MVRHSFEFLPLSSSFRHINSSTTGGNADSVLVTTPCSAYNQLQWRLTDRDSWDNIVDADGNKVLYLLNRPLNQSYDEPERLWYHDGCVLLDGDK